MTDAQAVAETLAQNRQRDPTPVVVKIGRATYVGASYIERDTGDRRFYLLGERPPSSRRGTVYRLPGDDGDWYLAGWMEQSRINPSIRQFHPHGAWFLLSRWPHEQHGRIDAHEGIERRRMEISLEESS